jgi:hypothetical protein
MRAKERAEKLARIEDTCRSIVMRLRTSNGAYILAHPHAKIRMPGFGDYMGLYHEEMKLFCKHAGIHRTYLEHMRHYHLAARAAMEDLEVDKQALKETLSDARRERGEDLAEVDGGAAVGADTLG